MTHKRTVQRVERSRFVNDIIFFNSIVSFSLTMLPKIVSSTISSTVHSSCFNTVHYMVIIKRVNVILDIFFSIPKNLLNEKACRFIIHFVNETEIVGVSSTIIFLDSMPPSSEIARPICFKRTFETFCC